MGNNQLLIDTLKTTLTLSGFYSLYIWSQHSAGRTHLLHASCHQLSIETKNSCYIPLEQHQLLTPEIFSGLQHYDLICLDNIYAIAGHKIWEETIFDFYNQLIEKNSSKLLITNDLPPKSLPLLLPDLASRLEWGQVYQLKELNDKDKLKALQWRAQLRGFDLPTEVGLFLLKRVDRDMSTLFNLLDQLDKVTISEQRKLTIPFIKRIFEL